MRRRALAAAVGMLLAVGVVKPRHAGAEGFVDLYGGLSHTGDARVSLQEFSPFLQPVSVERTADFGTAPTIGLRLGHWLESLPWLGLALDVSWFRAEDQAVDITVYPFSTLLMLRWPLGRTPDFPRGRLQPYAAIGPGLFIADVDIDFRPAAAERFSTEDADIGLDVRAGVAWQVHRHVALFTEYRFTHVRLEFEEHGCVSFGCVGFPFIVGTRREAEATLETHHLLFGVSFRF